MYSALNVNMLTIGKLIRQLSNSDQNNNKDDIALQQQQAAFADLLHKIEVDDYDAVAAVLHIRPDATELARNEVLC